MTAINRLSNKATLADNDLIPIWDGDAGRTRSVNAHSLAKYVSDEIDAGIYVKSGAILNRVLTLTYNNGQSITIEGFDPDGIVITDGVNSFDGVTSIEVGDNLELTQPEGNKVVITGLPSGVDFFTVEMSGLASTYTANHNLGRFIAVARVYRPDGEVAQVEVQNKDNAGNVSENVAQVISSVPMLGKLTLI